MIDIFNMGGPVMGILTIILFIILGMSVCRGMNISKGAIEHQTTFRYELISIKSVGMFALVTGIFGQLIGLYDVFSFIERSGSVSPAIISGGLKISMITTMYGMLIFLISYLLCFVLDYTAKRKAPTA